MDPKTQDDSRDLIKQAITRRDALKTTAALGVGAMGVHVLSGSPVRTAHTICCTTTSTSIILGQAAGGGPELQFLPDSAAIQQVFQIKMGANPAAMLSPRAAKLTVGDLVKLNRGSFSTMSKTMKSLHLTTSDMQSVGKAFFVYSNQRNSTH